MAKQTGARLYDIPLTTISLEDSEDFSGQDLALPARRMPAVKMNMAKPLSGPLNPSLIPHIIDFLPIDDVHRYLGLSWVWLPHAATRLYRAVNFTQLSGDKMALFLKTLQSSVLSSQGTRRTLLDYCALVTAVTITHIVFEQQSPLQAWVNVRDILSLCASNLEGISLGVGDDSVAELAAGHTYLHPSMKFVNLKRIEVTSKCPNMPENFVIELLRASPIEGLESIRFPRCMCNFSATGWFLIAERGGASLKDLELTPSVGFNMLGWEEGSFLSGVEQIVTSCPNIEFLDLSGHGLGFHLRLLNLYIDKMIHLKHLFLPYGLDDSHIVTMLTTPPWPKLESLGLSCPNVDKKGMSWNKFADNTLQALLEYIGRKVKSPKIRVFLPDYLIQVKTGRKIEMRLWLDFLNAKKNGANQWTYQSKLYISPPVNELIRYRDVISE